MNAHQELVRTLVPEIFQSERSASRHTRIEARRLGDVPPAAALEDVAAHADATLEALAKLSIPLELPGRLTGQAVGTTFSLLRDGLGDKLLDPERSYRGTLLGIQHGIHTMQLLHAVAARLPELDALTELAEGWLVTRKRLSDTCVANLAWFADHPEAATRPVGTSALERLLRGVNTAVGAGIRLGRGVARA